MKPASSFPTYVAVPHHQLGVLSPANTITLSKNTDTIPLPACGEDDFQSWILAPVFPGTSVSLLGELDKVLSVSQQRFRPVKQEDNAIFIEVDGSEGETVNLWTYNNLDKTVYQAKCQFDAAGGKQMFILATGQFGCQ